MLMNYLKSFFWSLGIFLSSIIILTIFNYFNILNGTILKVLELFIPLISIFIGSYKLGKTSNQKGYIDLDYLKKYAAEFRAAMDCAWQSMSQDEWRFMCTLKDSGNFKLATDILDIIERTEPAGSFV